MANYYEVTVDLFNQRVDDPRDNNTPPEYRPARRGDVIELSPVEAKRLLGASAVIPSSKSKFDEQEKARQEELKQAEKQAQDSVEAEQQRKADEELDATLAPGQRQFQPAETDAVLKARQDLAKQRKADADAEARTPRQSPTPATDKTGQQAQDQGQGQSK